MAVEECSRQYIWYNRKGSEMITFDDNYQVLNFLDMLKSGKKIQTLPNNVCTSICFYIYVKSTPSVKFTHSVFFKFCFFFANEFYKTKIIGSDSLIMKERYCYNKAAKSRPGVCINKSIVDI